MRVISPPPPVLPGQSLRTGLFFGKELVDRCLVDYSFESCIHAIMIFLS